MIFTIGTSEIYCMNLDTLKVKGPKTLDDFNGTIRSYDILTFEKLDISDES
jgi:hypothetical protein